MSDETSTAVEEKPVDAATEATTTETIPAATTETAEADKSEPSTEKSDQAEAVAEEKKEAHVVRRMYKFMHKAAAAEAELNALKAKIQQPVVETPPSRNQFPDDASYLAAAVHHEVKKQMPILQQAATQAPQVSAEDVKKDYDDYEEVMEDAYQVNIPDSVTPAVTQSPLFEHLRYYLTKHADKAKALFSMTEMQATKEIGKIEGEIERGLAETAKPAPAAVSKARPPITPVKLQGSTSKVDENKLSDQDWFKLERQRTMERNKNRFKR